jgi:hypothetical protein
METFFQQESSKLGYSMLKNKKWRIGSSPILHFLYPISALSFNCQVEETAAANS